MGNLTFKTADSDNAYNTTDQGGTLRNIAAVQVANPELAFNSRALLDACIEGGAFGKPTPVTNLAGVENVTDIIDAFRKDGTRHFQWTDSNDQTHAASFSKAQMAEVMFLAMDNPEAGPELLNLLVDDRKVGTRIALTAKTVDNLAQVLAACCRNIS